jgi:hypothetical protein
MSSYGFPAGTPEYYRAWKAANRKRINAWTRKHYAENKEVYKERERERAKSARVQELNRLRSARFNAKRHTNHRRWRLQKKFGITPEQYDAMFTTQGGVCAICQSPNPKGHKFKYLCVDHCHVTKVVRGLLCSSCNTAIGHLGDDLNRLLRAAEYILRNSAHS